MPINSIGDQARAFALQAGSNRIKQSLTRLTAELARGEVLDLGARLNGNTRILAAVETRLASITQFQRNASDAAMLSGGVQEVLAGIRAATSRLAIDMTVDPFANSEPKIRLRGHEAAAALELVVGHLNTQVAGRHVMGGLASDLPPVSPANEILDLLQGVVAGLGTGSDIGQAIADWFDAPPGGGGFLDSAYRGTVGMSQTFGVAEGASITLSTSAASPEIREVLKSLATAALLDRGVLAGDTAQARVLIDVAGRGLVAADHAIIDEMGRVGLTEQLIDNARTTNSAALSVLNLTRNEIRAADPFATAAALSEVQSQLETVYAVTARVSKLKLVDYIR
ncbi:MAG: hypothetical protein P3W94_008505 [Paracoccus sp. (in: a-proteobacteria)]|nr:hypothetical protein [Paracoccus sp. (in: a-proteobacteria)]